MVVLCCDPLCLAEPRAHTPDGAEEVADAAAERRAASASCAAARAASSARACSPARQPALTTHVPASTAPASAPPLAPARLLLVSWRANVQTPTGQPRHGTRHAATLTAFALGARTQALHAGAAREQRGDVRRHERGRRQRQRVHPATAVERLVGAGLHLREIPWFVLILYSLLFLPIIRARAPRRAARSCAARPMRSPRCVCWRAAARCMAGGVSKVQDMIDHNHTQPWLLQCVSSGPQPARLQGLHLALERTRKQHLTTLTIGVRAQSVDSRLTGGAANMMPGGDRVSRERSRRPCARRPTCATSAGATKAASSARPSGKAAARCARAPWMPSFATASYLRVRTVKPWQLPCNNPADTTVTALCLDRCSAQCADSSKLRGLGQHCPCMHDSACAAGPDVNHSTPARTASQHGAHCITAWQALHCSMARTR